MAGYRITCLDWESSRVFPTREAAERLIAVIEAKGACREVHAVVPVDQEAPMENP